MEERVFAVAIYFEIPSMEIHIAKSAGFCLGVKRALRIASETAETRLDVEMLGDIVHNEDVVHKMEELKIKKIDNLTAGCGKTLLIRAHGTSRRTVEKAKSLGYEIVDATCPMVKEIHRIAVDMEGKGYRIIIIGDKYHDEVLGIVGQIKTEAIVLEGLNDIPVHRLREVEKAAVVVQSTQNIDKVMPILGILKKYVREVSFFNTICAPTRLKQAEMKKMPVANDVMLIIGSKKSANTKRLYEISKSFNPCTYWIRSSRDISLQWFEGLKTVGITAGASTPRATIEEVVTFLNSVK